MRELLASTSAAWFVLAGVILGLLLAAGAAAWLTKKISGVISEARKVVEEMKKVVAQARGVAATVAEHYVPLEQRVRDLEAWRRDFQRLSRMDDQGGG
jgi:hypothetical protein